MEIGKQDDQRDDFFYEARHTEHISAAEACYLPGYFCLAALV